MPNTDHELNVYRISGEEPGKTLMIIGGIQGDEPGSYMTADLYADIHLKKGNLIVVPRANLYSILLNKREGRTGDMNRKFSPDDKEKKQNLEEEVVSILKHLIAESDLLLNLHEGSGFYNPKWLNDMENPMRFGQSIIFDASRIEVPPTKHIIDLELMAGSIIDRVNKQISNKRYHFRPNNHNTLSDKSQHKEQRKSATYYALTQAHIPAFGIETSKSIDSLPIKINLHKLVINSVMEEMGIVFDTPGLIADPPELQYLLVKVNGGYPYALPNGSVLDVGKGDEVVVTDIIGNYRRGLIADVEGFGSTNDTNRPFRVTKSTRVIVRKDAEKCGSVELKPVEKPLVEVASVEKQSQETAKMAIPHPEKPAGEVTEIRKPAGDLPIQPTQMPVILAKAKKQPKDSLKKLDSSPEHVILSKKIFNSSLSSELRAQKLLVDVDGKLYDLHDNETLRITKGARITLQGVRTNNAELDNEVIVNFKGFAPDKSVNDGNDLFLPIYTDQDLWKRYSIGKNGRKYPIVSTYNNKEIGTSFIEIQ